MFSLNFYSSTFISNSIKLLSILEIQNKNNKLLPSSIAKFPSLFFQKEVFIISPKVIVVFFYIKNAKSNAEGFMFPVHQPRIQLIRNSITKINSPRLPHSSKSALLIRAPRKKHKSSLWDKQRCFQAVSYGSAQCSWFLVASFLYILF